MEMDIKKNQQEFEELLRSTGREGMDFVIEDLEKDGFFEAPASASHHLNTPGGLCQHSLNVCKAGLMILDGLKNLDPATAGEVKREVGTVGRCRRLQRVIQGFSDGPWREIGNHAALQRSGITR